MTRQAVGWLCCCALVATVAGCSLAVVHAPPAERPASGVVECDVKVPGDLVSLQGEVAFYILILAIVGGLATLEPLGAAVGIGVAAGIALASYISTSDVERCRDAKECVGGDAASCRKIGWPTETPEVQHAPGSPP